MLELGRCLRGREVTEYTTTSGTGGLWMRYDFKNDTYSEETNGIRMREGKRGEMRREERLKEIEERGWIKGGGGRRRGRRYS